METTNFELFKSRAKGNVEAFQNTARREGIWTLKDDLKLLTEFQNKINYRLMNHMFGERLGQHYWADFREIYDSNVLNWMQRLDDEARIYVLHELKTNATLYFNC